MMPGKVNPVMSEVVVQVAAQVIGNDAAITVAGQAGNFELNVMMPLMAHNLLQSITLLANACRVFAEKCVADLNANEEQCHAYVEKSIAMITALVPVIGYDRAAQLAQEVYVSGKTVREVLLEKKIMSEKDVARILDPWAMTQPGIPGVKG